MFQTLVLQVKPECPLCKQSFKSIIHNVRSNEDYDQYHLRPAAENPYPWMNMINIDMVQQRFRYRYVCQPHTWKKQNFAWIPWGKRLLGEHRGEVNTEMDLWEIVYGDVK